MTQPTDKGLEARAREMIAEELEKHARPGAAEECRNGIGFQESVKAVMRALSESHLASLPTGEEWKEIRDRQNDRNDLSPDETFCQMLAPRQVVTEIAKRDADINFLLSLIERQAARIGELEMKLRQREISDMEETL